MLLTTADLLGRRLPGVRCRVIAPDGPAAMRLEGLGLGVIRVPRGWLWRSWLDMLHAGPRRRQRGPLPALTDRPFDYVDAVVDSGGFANSDQHGIYGALGRLRDFRRPADARLPMLFMTQSWGPFRRPAVRWLSRRLLAPARLAVARERASLGYLRDLRLDGPCRLEYAPDMAFQFRGDDPRAGDDLLRAAGCPAGRMTVGLTPNLQVYWRAGGRGRDNPYVQLMIQAARHFLAKDAQVVLAPHYIVPGRPDRDDRMLCGWIADAVGRRANLTYLDGDYSARRLKSMIGRLDFLVTSRYHTIIAAFSQRVPAAAVGWSHKYDELFEAVRLADCQFAFGQAGADQIVAMLEDRFDRRDQLRASLVQHVPDLERQSLAPFELAADMLGTMA
jgi:polysaccharide pyruvyl transferase WcaK-like protein